MHYMLYAIAYCFKIRMNKKSIFNFSQQLKAQLNFKHSIFKLLQNPNG